MTGAGMSESLAPLPSWRLGMDGSPSPGTCLDLSVSARAEVTQAIGRLTSRQKTICVLREPKILAASQDTKERPNIYI